MFHSPPLQARVRRIFRILGEVLTEAVALMR